MPDDQNVNADRQLAERASLKLSDFPTGWTSKPSDDSDEHKYDQSLADCLGVSVDLVRGSGPASVESPDFSNPEDDQTISSTVTYRTSSARIQKSLAMLRSSKAPKCFSEALTDAIRDVLAHPKSSDETMPKGATLGDATVSPMSFPEMGDGVAAFRVELPVKVSSFEVSVFFDVVDVAVGRVGVELTFEGDGTAPDPDDEERLTQLVVGRLVDT